MSDSPGFCRWCAGFLFTSGLTALLLWLTYRPITPRYFLVGFQLPPIANSTAPAANATVSFTLEVENKNKHMGILHDSLALSVSYGNRSGTPATIGGFYQGHDKTADKAGTAGAGWVPRGAAAHEVAAKGAAVFRVGVMTSYRYKVLLWKSRHRAVSVGAEVEVDGEGRKKAEKGIRLSNSGSPLRTGPRGTLVVAAAGLVMVAAAGSSATIDAVLMDDGLRQWGAHLVA